MYNNFLEEFLVGNELKFFSHKVHANIILNSCLVHSKMAKNTKKFILNSFTNGVYLVHNLFTDDKEFGLRDRFHKTLFSLYLIPISLRVNSIGNNIL